MRIVMPKAVTLALAVGVALAASAFGQVEFGIQSVESGLLAGIYTDPYQGYIGGPADSGAPWNGTPIAAFCDDFVNEIYPPQYWNANQTDLSAFQTNTSSVSSVYYGGILGSSQTADYIAVAWLAYQSLEAGSSDLTAQEDYSYALWDIFDPQVLTTDCPSVYGCLDNPSITSPTLGSNWGTALQDVGEALLIGNAYAASGTPTASAGLAFENDFNVDVNVFTPEPLGTCPNNNGNGCGPQEFVTVTPTNGHFVPMAEPSSWAVLGFDFVGVGLIGLAFRRRHLRNR